MLRERRNVNGDALMHYHNKDYKALANCDLKQIINSDGDTVIHLLAKDLDQLGIDLLLRYNPNQMRNVINAQNKKQQTPIDKAIETNGNNRESHQFVNYMIDNGAASNNIVREKLQNMNNAVVDNIKNLRDVAKDKIGQAKTFLANIINDNDNVDFIKKLTNYYAGQSGGYNGRRTIRNSQSNSHSNIDALTENGANDSFVTGAELKNNFLNHYDMNQYAGADSDVYIDSDSDSDVDSDVDSDYESNSGSNPNIKDWITDDIDKNSRVYNGNNGNNGNNSNKNGNNSNKNGNNSNKNGNKNNNRNKYDNDDIDLIDNYDIDAIDNYGKYGLNSRYNDRYDNDDDVDAMENYDNMNQDRPRDVKSDETYRSFVKKIMDNLDVDEETAKFYRSALKINLEKANPELKRRVNDSLKIKTLEDLINNKEKLKAALDKIDLDQIKQYMTERKSEGDRRRQENEGKPKENRSNRGTREQSTNKTSDDTITPEPSDKKIRKKKITNQKIAKNGYLLSDEIILS